MVASGDSRRLATAPAMTVQSQSRTPASQRQLEERMAGFSMWFRAAECLKFRRLPPLGYGYTSPFAPFHDEEVGHPVKAPRLVVVDAHRRRFAEMGEVEAEIQKRRHVCGQGAMPVLDVDSVPRNPCGALFQIMVYRKAARPVWLESPALRNGCGTKSIIQVIILHICTRLRLAGW